jgi:predicted MPP superfamily phosphohydrolase
MTSSGHWRRLAGYGQRRLLREASSPDLAVVEYAVGVPEDSPVAGRTLLYFADLHWPPPVPDIVDLCRNAWQGIRPDWVAFGGDLVTYACHLPEAIAMLRRLPPPAFPPAVAVLGNWDRRRRWLPHRHYRAMLAQGGFHLLVNESIACGAITFHGLDEPRIGRPDVRRLDEPTADANFHCLLSHCVEPVIESAAAATSRHPWQLALCGHSHAGQFRIPGFGAVLTSSAYGKSFEYGHYQDPDGRHLVVSAGIGCSRIPFRLFCQPEVVVVRFLSRSGHPVSPPVSR